MLAMLAAVGGSGEARSRRRGGRALRRREPDATAQVVAMAKERAPAVRGVRPDRVRGGGGRSLARGALALALPDREQDRVHHERAGLLERRRVVGDAGYVFPRAGIAQPAVDALRPVMLMMMMMYYAH